MTTPQPLPKGVYAAILTPLDDQLQVDHKALATHGRHLLDTGCDGLVLMGTTGEANAFTVAERIDLLDAVVEAGLPADRLMVGTGCCAYPDTVALTRHAVARGVGGVLMLPPFYYKNISDDGLFTTFNKVIQEVGEEHLHLYLYHFPRMSTVPFSHALIERLVTRYPDTVVGLKDSSGDWVHMKGLVEAFPGFRVFAGSERFLLDMLEAGGGGCISATTNITSRLAGEVYAQWPEGTARPLQERLTALRQALQAYPLIPALKRLMAERTGYAAWLNLRPPLVSLSEAEAAAMIDALRVLDFSFQEAETG